MPEAGYAQPQLMPALPSIEPTRRQDRVVVLSHWCWNVAKGGIGSTAILRDDQKLRGLFGGMREASPWSRHTQAGNLNL